MGKEEFSVICPYCGKEMEQGYIKSPQQIYWSDNKELGPASPGETRIRLSQKFWNGFFNGFHVESYYCPDCKKIVTSTEC